MAAVNTIGFFGMLAKIYNACGTLADAASNGAEALNNVALVGKIKSGTFAKRAELEQQAELLQLTREVDAQAQAPLVIGAVAPGA